ncbi:MAG: D-glycerate dehydrogenase, partial [Solirubrobacteraceae bacterium]|nr:D-glycerate dehydrogenase [Solirubrobacteraceae bacterium]
MAKIFVARALPGDAIERLRGAGHEVTVHGGSMPPTREELLAGVANADGLLSLLTDRVDGELLNSAPQLKAVANFAVGCDNIDLAAAAEREIPVGVAAHVLTDATADLTMALLLAAARNLPEGERDAREGRWKTWEPEGWLGRELRGAKLLIVGRGRIGQAVADRAEPFGMQISFAGRDDDLHAALAEADIVSIHCPLNEQTRHLIDAAALAAMKPDALLINTTRGGVVDQAALIEA